MTIEVAWVMKIILSSVLAFIAAIAIGATVVLSNNVENKGPEIIELAGGSRGNVTFPHHLHQANLKDCQICHSIFPQKQGSINEMKAEGSLKDKFVMNKLCLKCHRETKRSGHKSGPTTCTKCHHKS